MWTVEVMPRPPLPLKREHVRVLPWPLHRRQHSMPNPAVDPKETAKAKAEGPRAASLRLLAKAQASQMTKPTSHDTWKSSLGKMLKAIFICLWHHSRGCKKSDCQWSHDDKLKLTSDESKFVNAWLTANFRNRSPSPGTKGSGRTIFAGSSGSQEAAPARIALSAMLPSRDSGTTSQH